MISFTSPDITSLAKALLEVQRQLPPVPKDSENPFTKSTYASLKSVMDTCRDVLVNNGIWLCQCPVPVETPGAIGLLTKLTHAESGQWQSSIAVVPLPKADPQGMGSAITYARRYALSAMLGLVTEDDDGESAKALKPQPSGTKAHRQKRENLIYKEEGGLSNLLELDGVTYQIVKTQDGRDCIVATGNTQPGKSILSGVGFRWNAQRRCWWKYVDAA